MAERSSPTGRRQRWSDDFRSWPKAEQRKSRRYVGCLRETGRCTIVELTAAFDGGLNRSVQHSNLLAEMECGA